MLHVASPTIKKEAREPDSTFWVLEETYPMPRNSAQAQVLGNTEDFRCLVEKYAA